MPFRLTRFTVVTEKLPIATEISDFIYRGNEMYVTSWPCLNFTPRCSCATEK